MADLGNSRDANAGSRGTNSNLRLTDSLRKSLEKNYGNPLTPFRGGKLLDLGCGEGHFLDFVRDEGFSNYLGVDHDPEAIRVCQEAGHAVILSDVLDFFNASQEDFDVIAMNDLIEHFEHSNARLLVGGAFSRLVEGGLLVVRTPNASYLHSPSLLYGDLTHKYMYTSETLRQVLMEAGFFEISITGFRLQTRSAARGLAREAILKILGLLTLVLQGSRQPPEMNLLAFARKPSSGGRA